MSDSVHGSAHKNGVVFLVLDNQNDVTAFQNLAHPPLSQTAVKSCTAPTRARSNRARAIEPAKQTVPLYSRVCLLCRMVLICVHREAFQDGPFHCGRNLLGRCGVGLWIFSDLLPRDGRQFAVLLFTPFLRKCADGTRACY